jgi:hypothetical protein
MGRPFAEQVRSFKVCVWNYNRGTCRIRSSPRFSIILWAQQGRLGQRGSSGAPAVASVSAKAETAVALLSIPDASNSGLQRIFWRESVSKVPWYITLRPKFVTLLLFDASCSSQARRVGEARTNYCWTWWRPVVSDERCSHGEETGHA